MNYWELYTGAEFYICFEVAFECNGLPGEKGKGWIISMYGY